MARFRALGDSCCCLSGLQGLRARGARGARGAAPVAPPDKAPLVEEGQGSRAAATLLARSPGGAGKAVNGFATVPEPETIRIETDSNVAPFSLPQEVFDFAPAVGSLKVQHPDGDSERMIHNNVPLDRNELERLSSLREEAGKRGDAFYPSLAAAATRFIEDSRGDVDQALAKMRAAHEWRRRYFQGGPITDASVAEGMRSGVMYLVGRDRELRPALLLRPGRLSKEQTSTDEGIASLIRMLVFCIEYYSRYMLLPGRVENVCLIVDLKGMSVSQIPFAALKNVHFVLSQQQACRVARFYICSMPVLLKPAAAIVQNLMTDRQRTKICFVTTEELQKEFALHQLEEDLGGSRQLAREFLPFPLPPGPFGGGSPDGPRPDAVPDLHMKLSAAEVLGRSWDPALSDDENRRLERPGAATSTDTTDSPPRSVATNSCSKESGHANTVGFDGACTDASPTDDGASDFVRIEEEAVRQCSVLCCSAPVRLEISARCT